MTTSVAPPGERRAVVGLHVGAQRLRGLIATHGGRVTDVEEWYTRPERGTDAVVDTVLGSAAELIETARRSGARVTSVGVSVPGIVDGSSGTVRSSAALGRRVTPIRGWLEEHLDVPVTVAGDLHAAAVAESRFGAGCGRRRFALVLVGRSITAAEVGGDTSFDGGEAGGPGHGLVDPGRTPCPCGARSCPATAATTHTLTRRYTEASGHRGVTARGLLTGAAVGEGPAGLMWHEAVDALAEILVPLAGRVDIMAVGDRTAHVDGDLLLRPLRSALARRLTPGALPELVAARLGRDAYGLGAVCLARAACAEVRLAT
ncbi:ROK family protein [Streptomyces hydrogenans]|uniref:ROK family protein n=1 Tax=Streptomyces hydrogenans TaxID=1873719 RepID=UPI00332968C9